ncbi:MAG TPA: response regulator transcription factor [Thermodesulfobacteriota bacterium]|nr:response regulator transcription factor [Thermodesulfobacteriota bacterium]
MLRVLIVEDNHIFLEAFKKGLVDYFPSMAIEEAGNADEALKKIKGSPPHLIFMDIRLPGVNGLQLTQKIKKEFPNINVAILTDYDLPEYRQAAVQYGADHFFVKNSLKWDELEALVQSISTGGA